MQNDEPSWVIAIGGFGIMLCIFILFGATMYELARIKREDREAQKVSQQFEAPLDQKVQ